MSAQDDVTARNPRKPGHTTISSEYKTFSSVHEPDFNEVKCEKKSLVAPITPSDDSAGNGGVDGLEVNAGRAGRRPTRPGGRTGPARCPARECPPRKKAASRAPARPGSRPSRPWAGRRT